MDLLVGATGSSALGALNQPGAQKPGSESVAQNQQTNQQLNILGQPINQTGQMAAGGASQDQLLSILSLLQGTQNA